MNNKKKKNKKKIPESLRKQLSEAGKKGWKNKVKKAKEKSLDILIKKQQKVVDKIK